MERFIFFFCFSFRSILSTIGAIIPSFATYVTLLISIFYIFTMIGMELFQGTIHDTNNLNCGNPKLNNTEFAK